MSFWNRDQCYRKQKDRFNKKDLHPSWVGDPKGALRQFRDDQEINSIHVREYPDRICVHRDRYNPERRPIEHLRYDISPQKRIGAVVGGILGGIIGGVATQKLSGVLVGAAAGALFGYLAVDE